MYRSNRHKDPALVHKRDVKFAQPFKTPAPAIAQQREQPTRKRKRVSYKENGVEDEEEDDGRRKKRKTDDDAFDDDVLGELAPNINKLFPIYEPKPSDKVFSQRFSIPGMTTKDGKYINLSLSGTALGIRPIVKLLPRPLHNPMAEHAIVLYDPTIDDRESDEERLERLREEAKEAERKASEAKVEGLYNPHKSLRELLGENRSQKKLSQKVPVVIDPILSKILRPHQIEGVKACISSRHVQSSYLLLVPVSLYVGDDR